MLYLYVPEESSLLPKYRDCTTYNVFEIYLMCCGVMLLLLIISYTNTQPQPQPPIYASKQPPNLRNLLIRNTITDNEPECNKPCGKHRCKVCKHINTATNVLINHKKVKPGNHNCDSANVVYLIHCQKCPEALYIGETGGNFRYKFNNHTHSIRQKKFLPLPLHFNADDHNINDLKVCILKGNFKDTKHRKLT